MINPVHLRTLRAVIETGSFADAARLLGYTSSAVSQHINALERSSGVVLFDREPQSVHPTTAALVLAERARTALTALDQVEEDARLIANGREGRLRLGAFTTASTCIVPPALASFIAYRPRADVQLVEGQPDALLSGVLIGDLDIALVYGYDFVPREWPAELAVEEIFTEELVLMMPSSNHLASAPHIHFRDLANESWIAPSLGSTGTTALERLCATHGFEPEVAFRSGNYVVIRALVRAGLGMAIVPLLAHLSESGIKSSSLGRSMGCRRVLALYRRVNSNPLLPTRSERWPRPPMTNGCVAPHRSAGVGKTMSAKFARRRRSRTRSYVEPSHEHGATHAVCCVAHVQRASAYCVGLAGVPPLTNLSNRNGSRSHTLLAPVAIWSASARPAAGPILKPLKLPPTCRNSPAHSGCGPMIGFRSVVQPSTEAQLMPGAACFSAGTRRAIRSIPRSRPGGRHNGSNSSASTSAICLSSRAGTTAIPFGRIANPASSTLSKKGVAPSRLGGR